jgi:hypothetical protein
MPLTATPLSSKIVALTENPSFAGEARTDFAYTIHTANGLVIVLVESKSAARLFSTQSFYALTPKSELKSIQSEEGRQLLAEIIHDAIGRHEGMRWLAKENPEKNALRSLAEIRKIINGPAEN